MLDDYAEFGEAYMKTEIQCSSRFGEPGSIKKCFREANMSH
ncbi:hypothetical protein N665_1371s0019 [Sinapis alba]|nr:hypothetical protein N665_1371s0019 [Sinapis alba]